MTTTPQSQARRWLRTVAREGARYVSDLPIYDDEPYACMEAAACHYDYEGRDDLYMEEYIWVDVGRMTATLAVATMTPAPTAGRRTLAARGQATATST